MSVGLGRIEKRVFRVLEWERQQHDGNLSRLRGECNGKTKYYECDTVTQDLVRHIIFGCNDKDIPYLPEETLGKVYRSIYQSVCRAIRSLERRGLVTTFIIPGGDISGYRWVKAITLVKSGDKHLDTVKNNEGVNT